MSKRNLLQRVGVVLLSFLVVIGLVFPFNASAGLSKSNKFLGNVISSSVPSNFATYWDQVTPENASKWGSVESSRNNMNWTQLDNIYNYARTNRFPFKFHTLVWGSQEPSWISGLSATNQRAEVLEWIQAAGARYINSEFVDVVNEPLHAKPSFKDAIGGDGSTGWDWVIWSFEQARRYFPNSKLLINEYGIINDGNATDNYIKIINLLKARGLIDGIGIQCHYFNIDNVAVSTMKSNLDKLAATGLPIYVSELDISGDDSTQLARYREKFPVLWEHSAVKGVTLWGYIEGQTWRSNTHLITTSGTERPALKWLREYLGGASATPTPTPRVTPTPTPRVTPTPTPRLTPTPTPTPRLTPTPTPGAGGGLRLRTDSNSWSGGYTMNFTITNTSNTTVNGWSLTVNKSDFTISNIWNAQVRESGNLLIITPMSYNNTISSNGSVTFGLQGAGTPVSNFYYKLE